MLLVKQMLHLQYMWLQIGCSVLTLQIDVFLKSQEISRFLNKQSCSAGTNNYAMVKDSMIAFFTHSNV